MLHEFLTTHTQEIITRTQANIAARMSTVPDQEALKTGVSLFLSQLIDRLRLATIDSRAINESARQHGGELFGMGFAVSQVVHAYGTVCQVATKLAGEMNAGITAEEFHTFNCCLEDAITHAVTEHQLLQNAFKYSRPQGHIALRATATSDRVRIEVEDECGGLPTGKAEELLRPFEQRGKDRTDSDLGLTISRKGVERRFRLFARPRRARARDSGARHRADLVRRGAPGDARLKERARPRTRSPVSK